MTARSRAGRRSHAAGVSALEAAIAFAIGGSLLAVAIPAFVRELHASRFVEPVDGLARMSASAVAYARGRSASDAFPPSVGLTPGPPPRGTRQVDPPDAWEHPTWKALDFRPVPEGVPHAFSFGFDSTRAPGRSTFVAHAHGDLDGDGVMSTFEVHGHFAAEEPSGPVVDPGMVVEREVE